MFSATRFRIFLAVIFAAHATKSKAGGPDSFVWKPEFLAPQLTPKEFLIISSPAEKKIVYTELKNFKSLTGRTYPLVDSGLGEPCGVSLDRDRGNLYVADRQARKVFRYGVRVIKGEDNEGKEVISLATDANRLTVVAGRDVEWITVTYTGDLLFSDSGSKSINRVKSDTMDKLASGEFQAADLQVVSEKQMEANAAALASGSVDGTSDEVTDDTSTPSIFSVYEGSINSHVTTPSGVASDGVRLYWGNGLNGKASGSVVLGQVNPKPPQVRGNASGGIQPNPATLLANNVDATYGVAKSATMVFYSTIYEDSGTVFGVDAQQNTGNVYAFAQGLSEPRGLVWDGDNTMFVADQGDNAVYSFPVGRLVEASPLTKAVEFSGAFGVAVLTEQDAAWELKPSNAATWKPMFAWFIIVVFTLMRSA